MSEMCDTLGFAIAQLCKAHRNRIDLVLNKHGLHVGQEMILVRLWQSEGLTQSQLAEQMCVEPPTVTKMLQRLEREDLVERRADREDARVSRVFLTKRGRELQEPVFSSWAEVEAQTVAGLTVEERLLARRLILKILENLSL